MKVGFDIHGVIDTYPDFFRSLAKTLLQRGHEVHILTGHQKSGAFEELNALDFPYTKVFSIVDYHFDKGTEMERKDDGWWMEDHEWNSAKGTYAHEEGLDFHFDDQPEYLNYFPVTCHTMIVRAGFDKIIMMVLDILSAKWNGK